MCNVLYRVKPIFTKIDPKYFEKRFEILDKALTYNIDQMNSESINHYKTVIKYCMGKCPPLTGRVSKKDSNRVLHQAVINPCIGLLDLSKEFKWTEKKTLGMYENNGVYYSLCPDILVNRLFLFGVLLIEVSYCGLETYIVNGELTETNDEFNQMIQRDTSYMIVSNLGECIITELEVSIYLRPKLTKCQIAIPSQDNPKLKKYVQVPFEFKIIRDSDCGITLQAVGASIAYHRSELDRRRSERLPSKYNQKFILDKQVKHLERSLMMSASDQYLIDRANTIPQTKFIITYISKLRPYLEVDESRFYEPVIINLDQKLVPINPSFFDSTRVYLFPYKKYSKGFQNRGVSVKIPETVVLKVYDFTQLEVHAIYKGHCFNPFYNFDSLKESYLNATSHMLDSISFHEKHKLTNLNGTVREIYDDGIILLQLNGYPFSSGDYILWEYLEEL